MGWYTENVMKSLKMPLIELHGTFLTSLWRSFLSYGNHSIDLLCKWLDWFLYDAEIRYETVYQFLPDLTRSYPQKASKNDVFRGANRLKKSSCKVDLDFANLLLKSEFLIQRCIENPTKHLRWSFLSKIFSSLS